MSGPSLRASAAQGVKWRAISTAVAAGLQALAVIGLSRLLTLKEFGLMAVLVMLLEFGTLAADLGLGAAVVQKESPTDSELSSIFWALNMQGAALFLLLGAAAPLAARVYSDPSLARLIVGVAAVFPVQSWGLLYRALLQKRLRFGALCAVEVAAASVGALTAVVSALLGRGASSIVWGMGAAALLKSAGFVLAGLADFRPALRCRARDLRSYSAFGLYEFGSKVVIYFTSRIDQMLILLFLGPHNLGSYFLIQQLVSVPQQRINPLFTQVAFPHFALRRKDTPALRRGYLELAHILALISFPFLIGLGFSGKTLIPSLFGQQWREAVLLLPILIPAGMLGAVINPLGSLALAQGRADALFRLSLANGAAMTLLYFVAARQGLQAVAWAFLLRMAVVFVVTKELFLSRLEIRWKDYLRALAAPLAISLLMGAAAAAASRLAMPFSPSEAARLGAALAAAAAVWLLGIGIWERARVADWWGLIQRGGGRLSAARLQAAEDAVP